MDHTKLDYYQEQLLAQKQVLSSKIAVFAEVTKPYMDEVQRLEELIRPHINNYPQLYTETRQTVTRWEYGRGGQSLERGYYHPCPVVDLIAGGVHRGRLLKRPSPSKKPPDYIYGYNAEGQLVIVDKYAENLGYYSEKEIILYHDQTSIGLLFSGGKEDGFSNVMVCTYDNGQLQSMEKVSIIWQEISYIEIHEYSYSPIGIDTLSMVKFYLDKPVGPELQKFFNDYPRGGIFHDVYQFAHDEEGYISSYWQTCPRRRNSQPVVCEALLKRKV